MSTACSIIGLLLVIVSAVVVLIENEQIQQAVDSELSDIPDLVQRAQHNTSRTSSAEAGR